MRQVSFNPRWARAELVRVHLGRPAPGPPRRARRRPRGMVRCSPFGKIPFLPSRVSPVAQSSSSGAGPRMRTYWSASNERSVAWGDLNRMLSSHGAPSQLPRSHSPSKRDRRKIRLTLLSRDMDSRTWWVAILRVWVGDGCERGQVDPLDLLLPSPRRELRSLAAASPITHPLNRSG